MTKLKMAEFKKEIAALKGPFRQVEDEASEPRSSIKREDLKKRVKNGRQK